MISSVTGDGLVHESKALQKKINKPNVAKRSWEHYTSSSGAGSS